MTPARQLPLDLGHRPAMGAEDFLVADSNSDAVTWLDRWPDWPAPALVLHGPAGSGKTHLTQVWRHRTNAVTADPAILAEADPLALISARGAVAIDDAEAVCGTPGETILFHLYNLAREQGGHLLLTARRPPSRWPILLPDLASRLRAAPAVAVAEPDDSLLGAVMVKLFADRQVRVGVEVVAYLLPRIERSFAAARRMVAALDAASLARRGPITVPLARAVLDELERQEG